MSLGHRTIRSTSLLQRGLFRPLIRKQRPTRTAPVRGCWWGGVRVDLGEQCPASLPRRQRLVWPCLEVTSCARTNEGVRCDRDPENCKACRLLPIVVHYKMRLDEVIFDLAILVLAVLDSSSAVSDGSNSEAWASGLCRPVRTRPCRKVSSVRIRELPPKETSHASVASPPVEALPRGKTAGAGVFMRAWRNGSAVGS